MFLTPDKHADVVEAFVSSLLEPGEQLDVTLSNAHIGSWFKAVMPILGPLLGGELRPCAVVVTDRRVLLVALSGWTSKPRSILQTYPRSEVTAAWRDGSIVLSLSDGSAVRIEIPQTAWAYQARDVVDSLNDRP
jgi:hypothetical protein